MINIANQTFIQELLNITNTNQMNHYNIYIYIYKKDLIKYLSKC